MLYVAAALSQAKGTNEAEKTQPKGGKFVKRVISNPKSPSDTTIYAPALNLTPEKVTNMTARNVAKQVRPDETSNQVTRFLNTMRVEAAMSNKETIPSNVVDAADHDEGNNAVPGPSETHHINAVDEGAAKSWVEQARETANKLILEAEQMKAKLEVPQGMSNVYHTDQMDDNFFHITCHVDDALKAKIEKGLFVELEKLLVKDRPFGRQSSANDNRMGLFTKDRMTYFAPTMDRDVKISNVRKW